MENRKTEHTRNIAMSTASPQTTANTLKSRTRIATANHNGVMSRMAFNSGGYYAVRTFDGGIGEAMSEFVDVLTDLGLSPDQVSRLTALLREFRHVEAEQEAPSLN